MRTFTLPEDRALENSVLLVRYRVEPCSEQEDPQGEDAS